MAESVDQQLLTARIRVPEHVVRREFREETVVLNLETGMYYGLNPTAAQMFDEIEAADSVSEAIDELTARFDQPANVIRDDVLTLCRALEERRLIVRVNGS